MESKPWYQSKVIWTGIIAVAMGLYDYLFLSLGTHFNLHLPAVPEFVYAILAALGIYFRTGVTTTITK